jgi:integrase
MGFFRVAPNGVAKWGGATNMFKYRLYQREQGGTWHVAIGRKTRKSTETTDKEQARVFAETLAERLWKQHKLGDRSAVSFAATAESWLNADAKEKRTDRIFLEWLLPKIGNESLSDVAHPDALEELRRDGKAEGWCNNTIDRMMTTVGSVLNFPASRQKGRDPHAPPPARVSVPKYNEKLDEPQALTPEQYGRLMEEVPAHTNRFARLGTTTLLRMRSMLKLKWARVDFERRVAWIPGKEMKQEKTFTFPLSDAAIDVLKEIRTAQEQEYASYVEGCARKRKTPRPYPEHVCTYRLQPIDDLNGAAFKAACARAGVPWCTWHILTRHTGASWGAQNGVTLEERMKLGGWRDQRSAQRYSHLEDSQVHRAADRVAQMLHKALPPARAGTRQKAYKNRGSKVWSQSGSNRRPLPCHGQGSLKNQRVKRG